MACPLAGRFAAGTGSVSTTVAGRHRAICPWRRKNSRPNRRNRVPCVAPTARRDKKRRRRVVSELPGQGTQAGLSGAEETVKQFHRQMDLFIARTERNRKGEYVDSTCFDSNGDVRLDADNAAGL